MFAHFCLPLNHFFLSETKNYILERIKSTKKRRDFLSKDHLNHVVSTMLRPFLPNHQDRHLISSSHQAPHPPPPPQHTHTQQNCKSRSFRKESIPFSSHFSWAWMGYKQFFFIHTPALILASSLLDNYTYHRIPYLDSSYN